MYVKQTLDARFYVWKKMANRFDPNIELKNIEDLTIYKIIRTNKGFRRILVPVAPNKCINIYIGAYIVKLCIHA